MRVKPGVLRFVLNRSADVRRQFTFYASTPAL